MRAAAGGFWPLRRSSAWVPLVLGAASIGSLLLYFFGVTSLRRGTGWLLLPSVFLLAAFVAWRRSLGDHELVDRIGAGLWAGALATLAYDLVRVPISESGIPVFKAISYFGTVMLGETRPTLATELLGWSYHLSNGIGFGLMYTVGVARPSLWTAMGWGLILEGVMLLTPYVEVLGYRASPTFFAVTIGAHLIYGAVLWAGLAGWRWLRARRGQGLRRTAILAGAVLGIGAIAAVAHSRHAATIPPSPPSYIGEHLYTTWNVLEPDRVAVVWVVRRFADPEAEFHFVEPFTRNRFGTPLDIPEAEVRRSATNSATRILLQELGLVTDPKLRMLGDMTQLFEIATWQLPAHPAERDLGLGLTRAVGDCEAGATKTCIARGLLFLDNWYTSNEATNE